jgi:MFS family permease
VIFATTVLTQAKGINFENSLLLLIVVNVVGFFGYIAFGWVGDRFSRRNLMAIGWALAGISYAAMILFANGFYAVMAVFALSMFFNAGVYAPTFTYFAESYPTRMRGSGASFANATGQIGGLIGSVLIFGARDVAPRTELEAIAT